MHAKFKIVSLTALIIVGIFYPATSSLIRNYGINSSGLIIYPVTRPLHIQGKNIKDSNGNVVYLGGINRPSGFTASCTGNWFEDGDWVFGQAYTSFTETGLRQRMQQMKDARFNVVRLIFFADWWLYDMSVNIDGQPTDTSCRTAMRRTIEVAQDYGIYVVLSLYSSDAGATAEEHFMPFPSNTIPNVQAFVDFWTAVASEYSDLPNVIFELFNEPTGDKAVWFDAVQQAIDAIRTITDHIIVVQYGFCGGFEWLTEYQLNDPLGNILYSNHIYRYPPGATMYPGVESYDDIKNNLITNWSYDVAVNGSYPVWIGEIGASTLNPETSETTWWRNVLQLLNDWEWGYAAWNWDQPSSGWDLQNPTGVAPYLPNERGQILIDAIGALRA